MATAVTSEDKLPASARPSAQKIRLLGFGWRYAEQHALGDVAKRVQVRDIAAVAPPREVVRYAQALKRGDEMPPVVFTRDGYLVDGATRTAAARRLGWRTYPAFEIDAKYEDAPEVVKQQLLLLGAAFNLTHGRGMNTANVARLIEQVSKDDDSPSDIARKLHTNVNTVSTVMNAKKARDRAGRLGVRLDETLTNSALRTFGGKSVKYTDPVFKEFIQLAQDAKMSMAAISDVSRRLEESGSEKERLEILAGERRSYHEVINGQAARPSRAAKLRQSLGFLNGQDDPDLLVEREGRAAPEHIKALTVAAERLQKVLSAQLQMERARGGGEYVR